MIKRKLERYLQILSNIDSDEDKFIDISDAEGGDKEEEEDPLDSFGIEGEDTTGRNSAFEAFKQIENQIEI